MYLKLQTELHDCKFPGTVLAVNSMTWRDYESTILLDKLFDPQMCAYKRYATLDSIALHYYTFPDCMTFTLRFTDWCVTNTICTTYITLRYITLHHSTLHTLHSTCIIYICYINLLTSWHIYIHKSRSLFHSVYTHILQDSRNNIYLYTRPYYRTVPNHAMPCHPMSYHTMPCHAIQIHTIHTCINTKQNHTMPYA